MSQCFAFQILSQAETLWGSKSQVAGLACQVTRYKDPVKQAARLQLDNQSTRNFISARGHPLVRQNSTPRALSASFCQSLLPTPDLLPLALPPSLPLLSQQVGWTLQREAGLFCVCDRFLCYTLPFVNRLRNRSSKTWIE